MFYLIITNLIVGFFVNLKCLDRPDGFSWKDALNPFGSFKSGWVMSHSDAFLRSAFYNAPFLACLSSTAFDLCSREKKRTVKTSRILKATTSHTHDSENASIVNGMPQ